MRKNLIFARRYRLYQLLTVVALIVLIVGAVSIDKLHLHSSGDTTTSSVLHLGTPTTVEAQQLATAQKLFDDGHDEDALALLKPLMGASNKATVAQAMMMTANIQRALGNSLGASDTLTSLRAQYPLSPEGNDAQFMLGQIHASEGQHSRAIEEWSDFAKRNADVAPYVNLLIAQNLDDEGKTKEALAKARALATQNDVIQRVTIEALEQVRAIQLAQGDAKGYILTTNQLLELATVPGYRAQLIYERGNAEKNDSDQASAIADLNEVVQTYPDSSFALQAAASLAGIGSGAKMSRQQIGLLNYDAGNYPAAISAFSDALSTNPLDDSAWYYRAMSTLRSGDDKTAATQLAQLPVKFPQSLFIPDALYTAGRLNEGYGNLLTAVGYYQNVLTHNPQADTATNTRLRLGFDLYLLDSYPEAIDVLKSVTGDAASLAQASFWQGKAYKQLKQTENATVALQNAAKLDPLGYYGQRASQLLAGASTNLSPTNPPQTLNPELTADQNSAIDRWYESQGTTVEQARATAQQSPALLRLNHLTALGLTRQAGWELSDFADQHAHNLPVLAQYGQILLESGQYIAAYRVGLALQTDADALGTTLPDAVERIAYPLAYISLVQLDADQHKVDPLLFLALIRQESGYDPGVTSAADARGLAQIVPNTAKLMAAALGLTNWNTDLLYRPYAAIDLGTQYLRDRLNIFDGSIVESLAAYNAGDSNATDWATALTKADPDDYVESIPFSETYDYVKIVYANYLTYLRLYR